MHSESQWVKPEGLLLECSVSYLELRQLKLKYTWQLTPVCYRSSMVGCHRQYKFRSWLAGV